MKKVLFSTLLASLMLLLGTSAFAAYVETVTPDAANDDYQFVKVEWKHTYDGTVPGSVKAMLSIVADDVDPEGEDGEPAEVDKVFINGTYLGDLLPYNGEFTNGRINPNYSTTVFEITPFLASVMNLHIEVFNGASSYAMELISSTLTVSSTPIPGAIFLLGSGLVGLVGIRRKFA